MCEVCPKCKECPEQAPCPECKDCPDCPAQAPCPECKDCPVQAPCPDCPICEVCPAEKECENSKTFGVSTTLFMAALVVAVAGICIIKPSIPQSINNAITGGKNKKSGLASTTDIKYLASGGNNMNFTFSSTSLE